MILNQACAKYAIDVDSSQKYTLTIVAYNNIVAYIFCVLLSRSLIMIGP